jgi:hypothetical protein
VPRHPVPQDEHLDAGDPHPGRPEERDLGGVPLDDFVEDLGRRRAVQLEPNLTRRPVGLSEVLLSRSAVTSQSPARAWYSTQFSSGMLLTSS